MQYDSVLEKWSKLFLAGGRKQQIELMMPTQLYVCYADRIRPENFESTFAEPDEFVIKI